MHLYFIDDSGDPNRSTEHFVLGGVIIPEDQWHNVSDIFTGACAKFNVQGEIKWRLFGKKPRPGDTDNPMAHLSYEQKDELRILLLESLVKFDFIKIIASVVHLPSIYASYPEITSEEIYAMAYKPLTERFQYYLQDLSRSSGTTFNGILVCDHRNPHQDKRLRNFHQSLLKTDGKEVSKYYNLIETLFLAPSDQSVGLQFSDLVVGSILRFFEKKDGRWYQRIHKNIRRDSQSGRMEGYGLIKIPKEWKENDAESRTSLEPAILTQSQRTPQYT